jgi:hypothetical protein
MTGAGTSLRPLAGSGRIERLNAHDPDGYSASCDDEFASLGSAARAVDHRRLRRHMAFTWRGGIGQLCDDRTVRQLRC